MHNLKNVLREFRRGTFGVSAFFLYVCPYITRSNVEEIYAEVPTDCQLSFRRLVAYQEPESKSYADGSAEEATLGELFIEGLAVLRDYFSREGTLQFGDYLFMERDQLKSLLSDLERSSMPVAESTIDEVKHELSLVEALLEIHPPEVLARFATAEGLVWPSVVRATIRGHLLRLPDSETVRSLRASALKPPRQHDDRWWLVYDVSPPVVFDSKADVYGFVCDDGTVKVVGDIAAIVSALESQA